MKIAHFRLPSASQKRACLSSLLEKKICMFYTVNPVGLLRTWSELKCVQWNPALRSSRHYAPLFWPEETLSESFLTWKIFNYSCSVGTISFYHSITPSPLHFPLDIWKPSVWNSRMKRQGILVGKYEFNSVPRETNVDIA